MQFPKPDTWTATPDATTIDGATQIVVDKATGRWPRNANELRTAVATLEADDVATESEPKKLAKKKRSRKKKKKKKKPAAE